MNKFKKIIILILSIFVMVSFTGCDMSRLGDLIKDIEDSTKLDTSVSSIEITGDTTVSVGEQITLKANVLPNSASQKVIWSVQNPNIAFIDENGVITGLNPGKTVIRATSFYSTVYKNITVTVTQSEVEPTSIQVNGSSNVYIGSKTKYTITTTPENAKKDVAWSVDNSNVASINFEGVLEAKSVGTVVITASYSDDIKATLSVSIEEKTNDPQKISVKGYNEIYVNEVTTIEYSVLPSDAIDLVVWSSSDNEIASVDSKGRVRGLKPGSAVITATSTVTNTVKSSIEIKVLPEVNLENIETLSLQEQIKAVINYNRKSVFGVVNYQVTDLTESPEKSSIGSGFVYKAHAILNNGTKVDNPETITDLDSVSKYCYYLITNRHVVDESDEVTVYIGEYDKYINANVCGMDDKIDVAVVYFEHHDYIKPLSIADSSTVETGDFVVALGNPEGLEYYDSATLGIVSNPNRYYSLDTDGDNTNDWDQLYIQHDCAINPGNSGGPLFNLKGEVIAINTMKLASVDIDTMGFSIPTNEFMKVVPLLEEGETVERPLLGVNILQIKDALTGNRLYLSNTEYVELPAGLNYGLYVASLTEGGVAQIAGVKPGDIILSLDGVDILEGYQVRIVLGRFIVGSGETSVIEVYRNNQVIKLNVTF